jgi:invasion protein IalB
MLKRLFVVVLTLCGIGMAHAETNNGLARPFIDRSIYKPDAITRLTGRFDNWTVVCDEITALKRRFCTMRSFTGRDARGQIVRIDVSTGSSGKPAALLHLPLLIAVASGLDVRLAGANGGTGETRRQLPVASCNSQECLAVWPLDPPALQALLAGQGIGIGYCSLRPGPLEFATDLHKKSCEARLATVLSGSGFRQAVAAATHP